MKNNIINLEIHQSKKLVKDYAKTQGEELSIILKDNTNALNDKSISIDIEKIGEMYSLNNGLIVSTVLARYKNTFVVLLNLGNGHYEYLYTINELIENNMKNINY